MNLHSSDSEMEAAAIYTWKLETLEELKKALLQKAKQYGEPSFQAAAEPKPICPAR